MTKTEIVTALIAAQISRDYTGIRTESITMRTVEEALRVANLIIEVTGEAQS